MTRRNFLLRAGALGAACVLHGCATRGEPLQVSVVELDPLPAEGLELRMAVKLRLQNPGERVLDYDGISLELDLHGETFARGVSAVAGSVPRFGETVVTVPVSVSALDAAREVLAWAARPDARVDYTLRGRLSSTAQGSTRFETSGDVGLPPGLFTD